MEIKNIVKAVVNELLEAESELNGELEQNGLVQRVKLCQSHNHRRGGAIDFTLLLDLENSKDGDIKIKTHASQGETYGTFHFPIYLGEPEETK